MAAGSVELGADWLALTLDWREPKTARLEASPGSVMIVVSAATGEFGRLVVDRLLERGPATEVAVAVRNAGKADDLAARGVDVRYGDYDEPASLRAAFDGADRLLFISSPTLENRVAQHRRVVTAARDAGVGSIAYTSGLGADVVEEGLLGDHHATEQAIVDSGAAYTFLRHPIHTEMFISSGLRAAVEAGERTSSPRPWDEHRDASRSG